MLFRSYWQLQLSNTAQIGYHLVRNKIVIQTSNGGQAELTDE